MKSKLLSLIAVIGFVNLVNAQVSNPATEYPQKMGNLRFKTNYMVFPSISSNEKKTDTVKFYNEGDREINLSLSNIPPHVKCDLKQKSVKPGEKGMIIVEFDASKVDDFGFVIGRFHIETNDSLSLQKIISIGANIVEDFSKLTPEEKANAPKIVFKTIKHDFGTATDGETVKYDFVFTNEGKNDLIIRKTKASCGCTAISPNKTVLKSGESSQVGISFNTAGRLGKQSKNVTVISNDPEKSTVIITIEGLVEAKPQ